MATAAVGAVLGRGELRIPFGLGHGLRLDAAMLDLASVQTGGMLRGLHEMQVQEALRRHLPVGGTFVDVGAHIGYFSLMAARVVGPRGRVVAIDPVEANVTAIRRHAALNNFDNVEAVRAAATGHEGVEQVIEVSDSLWTRLATVGDHPLETRRAAIRGVTVDAVLRDRGLDADVVKIDVEGAELTVLDGMRQTLTSRRAVVLCEMHGKNQAFAAALRHGGYRVKNLDGPQPIETAGDNDHAEATPAEPR